MSTKPGPGVVGAVRIATLDEEDLAAIEDDLFPEITSLIKAGRIVLDNGELWCMQEDHAAKRALKDLGE